MVNYSSFSTIIRNTISNDILHFSMIFIEYIICIYPSSFNSGIKMHLYKSNSQSYNLSPNMTFLSILTYFHWDYPFKLLYFIIFIITLFSLVLYYILRCYLNRADNRTLKINFLIQSLINYYDIIFFRYFSLIFLDSIISLFILSLNIVSLDIFLLPFIFFALMLFYLITAVKFIKTHCVRMNISNPLLVSSKKRYPFDQISKEYEILMIILKVVISIEHNVFQLNEKNCSDPANVSNIECTSVNFITLFFNILIYIIILIAFIRLDIIASLLNFRFNTQFANQKKNLLRKYILGFNIIITTFILIAYNRKDTYFKSIILIACSLIITCLFFCLYYSFRLNALKKNNTNWTLSSDVLLYMLINNTKSKSKITNEIKHIQDVIFLCHIKNCNYNLKQCPLCSEYSNNIDNNLRVFINYFKLFKDDNVVNCVYVNKDKDTVTESQYNDIIDLFYYQIKKNTYSFFLLFYRSMKRNRDDSDFTNNLQLIVNDWLNKDDISQTDFFNMIIELYTLENKLTIVLNDFVKLSNERVELLQHKIAFTLAKRLKSLIDYLKKFQTKNEMKEDLASNDIIVKLTNSVMKFNVTMLRYIIESLLNQELTELPALNIDLLEDYLNMHYTHDNLLIMSINPNLNDNEVKLLKVTGELSNGNPKVLSDFFPKKINSRLLEIFRNKIKSPQSNTLLNYNLDYLLLPFKYEKVLHMIKYSYRLSEVLKNDSLIIYGYYTKEVKNCIIFDTFTKKNDLLIVDACKEFFTLTKLKSSWITYLNIPNITISLSSVFQSVVVDANHSTIECILDYNYLIKSFPKLSNRLLKCEEFKEKSKNIENLTKVNNKYATLANRSFIIQFEKIEDITKGYYSLYHMNTQKTINTQVLGSYKYDQIELSNKNYFNQNLSNTSMTQDHSYVSAHLSKKTKGSEYQMINVNLKKKIEKETKNLSLFSLIMIFLNVTLIIICTIFLITQINKTQVLSQANDFLFQFKSVRLCVANFVMSIAAMICFAKDPSETNCENALGKYSIQFMKDNGLGAELNLVEFVIIEVKLKAVFAQDIVSSVLQEFYSSGIQKYIDIFSLNMTYYIYDYSSGKTNLVDTQIPFHEALRKYINSIYIICDLGIEIENEPLYFITYSNGTYSFDNVKASSLTVLQEEAYNILINYFNFAVTFNNGEAVLQSSLATHKSDNIILNSLFMISIALLNVILFILCFGNLKTAYSLFKVLIFNVINQLEDAEFSKYFKNKIIILKQLSKMYHHNPNDLINKNNDDRIKYLATQNDKKTNCNGSVVLKSSSVNVNNGSGNGTTIDDETNRKLNHLNLHFGSQFYYSVVLINITVLLIAFGLYFIIIITLDVTLSNSFTKLFEIYEYVYLQYTHENVIFVNLCLVHLTALLNITQSDLALLLDKPNSDDGLLNYLIRDSFDKYYTLFRYKNRKDPKNFPSLADHVDYDCDTVYTGLNDSYMRQIVDGFNEDFEILPSAVCNTFHLLNLPGFAFLLLDLEQRTQELANIKLGTDYQSLYKFTHSILLYESYTIALIMYRPLCSFFRHQHLLPTLNKNFSDYILFVVAYLCVNIIFEILIFALIKWFILRRLERIQSNLYLLNNCVN